MPLDFERAVALFLSTEEELAGALGIGIGDLRKYRNNPARTPDDVLEKLGRILIERGKGMQRVGELLVDTH
ncbi:MAG TPA: hypothetical protein VM100_00545 [Longimicrobiales bacterium]|nr:hypothetical protein [Longimicrobiales bacterium]